MKSAIIILQNCLYAPQMSVDLAMSLFTLLLHHNHYHQPKIAVTKEFNLDIFTQSWLKLPHNCLKIVYA